MKYRITIGLKHESNLIFSEKIPYFNSYSKFDCVEFSNNAIILEAERNRLFNEDDLFLNVQNSLYNQMLKCLLIHYCHEGSNAGISDIQVAFFIDGGYSNMFHRVFNDINQPYPSFDSPVKFEINTLKNLLKEDDDNYKLRIIISHWLCQGNTKDPQRKMEFIWRTFEQLCDHSRHAPLGERSNIAQGLDNIAFEMIHHPDRYKQSSNSVKNETLDSLRKLRWREMIENNYSKTRGRSNLRTTYDNYLRRLITPYTDLRVCSLMKEVLVYRRDELRRYSLFSTAENQLNTQIAANITKDIDVVVLLCYYAYYLRNRLFHGQTLLRTSIFDINKKDDLFIDKITRLLSILSIELINNFHLI